MRRRGLLVGASLLIVAACGRAGTDATDAPSQAASVDDAGGSEDVSVTPIAFGPDAAPIVTTCTPGELIPCYEGPPSTRNVGRCHDGYRRCAADGTALGECTRAVLPAPVEDCATPDDDDCNGKANDGCVCAVGDTRACYTGPAGTLGLGACHAGTQACRADGAGFEDCKDERGPSAEVCANLVDDDCDGLVDEEGSTCACAPGSTQSCYFGPSGTLRVGICRAGFAACKPDGSGFGACVGQVLPQQETCGNYTDENCDGVLNEGGPGCVCKPGDTLACYTGAAGTSGVGVCKSGAYPCRVDGSGYYGPPVSCAGEVTPQADDCGSPGDEDCDGTELVCLQRAWIDEVQHTPAYRYPGSAVGFSDAGEVVSAQRDYSYDWTLQVHGPSGARIVSFDIGGGGTQNPPSVQFVAVAASAAGIYLAGSCNGSFSLGVPAQLISCSVSQPFVVKLRRDGSLDWSQTLPAPGGGTFTDVRLDASGDLVGSGSFNGTMIIDGVSVGLSDVPGAFATKVSALGERKWLHGFPTRQYGNAPTSPAAIGAANGDVVAVMPVRTGVDLGAGALPTSALVLFRWTSSGSQVVARTLADLSSWGADTYRLVEAPDQTLRLVLSGDGYTNLGTAALSSCGNCGAAIGLAKLAANGDVGWAKSLGALPYAMPSARDIGLMPSGAILVASQGVPSGASFTGATDLTLTRLAPDGTAQGAYSQSVYLRTHTSIAISRTGRTAFVGVQTGETGSDYVEVRDP